jgi:hypothetical protein
MTGNALIYRTVLQDKVTIRIHLELFFIPSYVEFEVLHCNVDKAECILALR